MDTFKKFVESTKSPENVDINIKKHSTKFNVLIASYAIILFTTSIITYYSFELISNIV